MGRYSLHADGPRVVIAAAKGELKSQDKKGNISAGSLVGSVVDPNRLRETGGVEVAIISEDAAVIKDVLEKLPCDLREGVAPVNRAAKCLTIFVTMSITSCATTGDDPLKNTKKLARGGASLPLQERHSTYLRPPSPLIPPAPSTYEFATELWVSGQESRPSLALKRASESVYIVSEGAEHLQRS